MEDYSQPFNNLNGTAPIEVTFDHTVPVTNIEDYAQVTGFVVSVNDDIPVSLVFVVNWRRFVLIRRLKDWKRR